MIVRNYATHGETMISDPGSAAIPAYSIRTKRRIPLSSRGSVPPYWRPTPPSIVGAGSSGRLVGALPNRMIPPQSPGPLEPAGWPLVNTIGLSAVPDAISLAPLSMIMHPFPVRYPVHTARFKSYRSTFVTYTNLSVFSLLQKPAVWDHTSDHIAVWITRVGYYNCLHQIHFYTDVAPNINCRTSAPKRICFNNVCFYTFYWCFIFCRG